MVARNIQVQGPVLGWPGMKDMLFLTPAQWVEIKKLFRDDDFGRWFCFYDT